MQSSVLLTLLTIAVLGLPASAAGNTFYCSNPVQNQDLQLDGSNEGCIAENVPDAIGAGARDCIKEGKANLVTAEHAFVCTVEELLAILESISCSINEPDLPGLCLFCPPEGSVSDRPVAFTSSGTGVTLFYFPMLNGGHDYYHVLVIESDVTACR